MKLFKLLIALLITTSVQAGVITPKTSVELIVPFPAGGSIDFIARALQQELQTKIESVTVLNRPGGDGVVASKEFFVEGGLTNNKLILLSTGTTLFFKLTKKLNPGYDSITDFNMIGPLAGHPYVLTVAPDSAVKTFDDLVKIGQTRPVNFGGNSTMGFFMIKHLAETYNFKVQVIPYKGGVDMIIAVRGNVIDTAMDGWPLILMNQSVRMLALTAPDPIGTSPLKVVIPEYHGYHFAAFYAVAMNNKTDPEVRAAVTEVLLGLNKNPEFVSKMVAKGYAIPKARTDFTQTVQKNYEELEKLRIKLQIEKE